MQLPPKIRYFVCITDPLISGMIDIESCLDSTERLSKGVCSRHVLKLTRASKGAIMAPKALKSLFLELESHRWTHMKA